MKCFTHRVCITNNYNNNHMKAYCRLIGSLFMLLQIAVGQISSTADLEIAFFSA